MKDYVNGRALGLFCYMMAVYRVRSTRISFSRHDVAGEEPDLAPVHTGHWYIEALEKSAGSMYLNGGKQPMQVVWAVVGRLAGIARCCSLSIGDDLQWVTGYRV